MPDMMTIWVLAGATDLKGTSLSLVSLQRGIKNQAWLTDVSLPSLGAVYQRPKGLRLHVGWFNVQ
jgi:hypothetical protein